MHLQPGDLIADKYRIESLLGEGGMGAVYAATNQLTGRSVALKWLRPELSVSQQYLERLLREARVTGRLDHPNIVNIFDAGSYSGSVFLVMELLRGESFETWLRRGVQSHTACVARLMPALRGVAAAHAAGIIHRDLKPDNIFLSLDAEGFITQTKVLDFGIAKELAKGIDKDKSLTSPGVLVGTIHYMSPEQVRAAHAVDVRCDVYALGIILYRSLCGDLPFKSESLADLIVEITEGRPEPLGKLRPELPRSLCDVVMRAISRDPAARFQSVAELAQALEPHAGGVRFHQSHEYLPSNEVKTLESPATSDPVAGAPAPNGRRFPALLWAPLGLLALGITVWLAWPRATKNADSELKPETAAPGASAIPAAAAAPAELAAPSPALAVEDQGQSAASAEPASSVAADTGASKLRPATRHAPPKLSGPPRKGATGAAGAAPSVAGPPRPLPAEPDYEDNPYMRR